MTSDKPMNSGICPETHEPGLARDGFAVLRGLSSATGRPKSICVLKSFSAEGYLDSERARTQCARIFEQARCRQAGGIMTIELGEPSKARRELARTLGWTTGATVFDAGFPSSRLSPIDAIRNSQDYFAPTCPNAYGSERHGNGWLMTAERTQEETRYEIHSFGLCR
jgi:hypothetical protein